MKPRSYLTNYGWNFDFCDDLITKWIDCECESEMIFLEDLIRSDTENFTDCPHLISVTFSKERNYQI